MNELSSIRSWKYESPFAHIRGVLNSFLKTPMTCVNYSWYNSSLLEKETDSHKINVAMASCWRHWNYKYNSNVICFLPPFKIQINWLKSLTSCSMEKQRLWGFCGFPATDCIPMSPHLIPDSSSAVYTMWLQTRQEIYPFLNSTHTFAHVWHLAQELISVANLLEDLHRDRKGITYQQLQIQRWRSLLWNSVGHPATREFPQDVFPRVTSKP